MKPLDAALAAARGESLAVAGLDPGELLQVLRRHKLISYGRCLELSPEQRALIAPSWRASSAQALIQAAERDRLLGGLAEQQIPALAYKGVVLQEWLTGRLDGRDSEDLDLWVPPLLFRRTLRWLVSVGYTLAFELSLEDLNAHPLPSELLLLHPGGMHLDVHQRFFAPHYALDAAETVLQKRAIGGLDDASTAWLVALGAAKDTWGALRHLADLAAAVERVDAGELTSLADRTHTRKLLDIGVQLASRWVRPIPWPARYPLPSGVDAALLAEHELPLVSRGRIYLSARERWQDRAAYMARLPFKVSALDLGHGGRLGRTAHRLRRLVRDHGVKGLGSALSGSVRREDG